MIGSLPTASATVGAQIAPVSKTAPMITGILRISSSFAADRQTALDSTQSATR
jgi:hypothetical protein